MSRAAGFCHPYRPTKPFRHPSGQLRVVVYMDDETYHEADALAKKANCSLSSQLRVLIDVGIEEFAAEEDFPALENRPVDGGEG